MIDVNIINKSNNPTPNYSTIDSAGCDICANENKIIVGRGSALIKTGLFVDIPLGYEIQIRGRSGIALKHRVTAHIGTIDSDYRGEIGVILFNHDASNFHVNVGDRIAQMVLNKVEQIQWKSVDELIETERGAGGFGSTGLN